MSEFDLDPDLAARLSLDDRSGPAHRIGSGRAQAMVDAALDAWPASTQPVPIAARVGWSRLGSRFASRLALAAAVLLAIVSSAAAARLYFVARAAERAAAVASSRREPPPLAARAIAPRPAPQAPSQIQAPDETSAAEDGSGDKEAPARARREGVEHAAPDDLLQKANRLRAAGRFRDAAGTYASVYEHNPHSLSAYVAEVAAGSIELEHLGRPARARVLFDRALKVGPAGALDIEARQGLALSLRDLGNTAAESAALRALIVAHPDSPAAARAQARLHELGAASR